MLKNIIKGLVAFAAALSLAYIVTADCCQNTVYNCPHINEMVSRNCTPSPVNANCDSTDSYARMVCGYSTGQSSTNIFDGTCNYVCVWYDCDGQQKHYYKQIIHPNQKAVYGEACPHT